VGQINPRIYGHFIEHLESCLYGGIWTADGRQMREDTLALIRPLRPPVVRYPGGNFASGYHWEDGIGPRESRPTRFDEAWKVNEPNWVGTDEFLAFCAAVGAAPYLCANDASGTPEEAARWVAYCNDPPTTEQGCRRAANGHPQPYGVRLWGIGNEVWGPWQIGHTDADGYACRYRQFAQAMRAADPGIELVAVGMFVPEGSAGDEAPSRLTPRNGGRDGASEEAEAWNATVLAEAADLMNYLSFHVYQPGMEGWEESPDPEAVHRSICAAPLDIEAGIQRLRGLIAEYARGWPIKLALDEWNVWPAPPPEATSMHGVVYTLRDALYVAGVLNVFHRLCRRVPLANLAQLVNVLAPIRTNATQAIPTAIYFPFLLYGQMEPLALWPAVECPTFDAPALGNIPAIGYVPYLDVTATLSRDNQRLVIGAVNRHPTDDIEASMEIRTFVPAGRAQVWELNGPSPLAANDFTAQPVGVTQRQAVPVAPTFTYRFPAHSVTVLALGTGE
jgi:alpha-N-arabinofuranosidase